MRVRFDFSDHIHYRAKAHGIEASQDARCALIGLGMPGLGRKGIDALADECRQLGLSVNGPDVVTPTWAPSTPMVFDVVVDPMGWIEVAIWKVSE